MRIKVSNQKKIREAIQLVGFSLVFSMYPHVYLACMFLCLGLQANEDIVSRARLSSWLPDVSIRYSYSDLENHLVWAAMQWNFDEVISGQRSFWAIKTRRLREEERRLRILLKGDLGATS